MDGDLEDIKIVQEGFDSSDIEIKIEMDPKSLLQAEKACIPLPLVTTFKGVAVDIEQNARSLGEAGKQLGYYMYRAGGFTNCFVYRVTSTYEILNRGISG